MADVLTAGQQKPTDPNRLTLEAWSQGFMAGALVIMIGITLANMRRGVLLHKLILIELVLAFPNTFFIFFEPPIWGWYLSSTVILLLTSWTLHNVIAWIKCKPFLGRKGNWFYIGSVILVQPYWILEIYANFLYFNGINNRLFVATRPFEALFRYMITAPRDPWWIFTIINLFWNIKCRYELGFLDIIKVSPRFAILLLCMALSVIFIVVDVLAVLPVIPIGNLNPFWKFAFVFKCFTDSIILDDFKAALDKLSVHRRMQIIPFSLDGDTTSSRALGTSERGGPKWRRADGEMQDSRSTPDIDSASRRTDGNSTSHLARGSSSRQAWIELEDVGGIGSTPPAVAQRSANKASHSE